MDNDSWLIAVPVILTRSARLTIPTMRPSRTTGMRFYAACCEDLRSHSETGLLADRDHRSRHQVVRRGIVEARQKI